MALLPENAVRVYRGQSKTLELTVHDVDGKAAILEGATIYFTIKREIGDPAPIVQKSSASAAQIEITAPREGKARIYIDPADTQNLDSRAYYFDVWVILASGRRYPVVPPSILEVEAAITVIPL